MSISLNNSTVLVLVNGKKFELTRTRTRNSNSTWLETPRDAKQAEQWDRYLLPQNVFVVIIIVTVSHNLLCETAISNSVATLLVTAYITDQTKSDFTGKQII